MKYVLELNGIKCERLHNTVEDAVDDLFRIGYIRIGDNAFMITPDFTARVVEA